MNYEKVIALTGVGAIGSFIASMFGGWSESMTTLIVVMGLDFISGIMVGASGNSRKTETGRLSSDISFKGITKKAMVLILVMMGHRIDVALNLDFVKDVLIIAYIVNESISIMENAGLLGLPIPKKIIKLIDTINKRLDETESKD